MPQDMPMENVEVAVEEQAEVQTDSPPTPLRRALATQWSRLPAEKKRGLCLFVKLPSRLSLGTCCPAVQTVTSLVDTFLKACGDALSLVARDDYDYRQLITLCSMIAFTVKQLQRFKGFERLKGFGLN